MRKLNKTNLWIGGFVGPWMALNAESVQINTETKGEITTIKIGYHRDDGSKENEEIQLRKETDHWGFVSKSLLDEANFDLSNPTDARCLVDGLELKLRPNGEFYLSGEYAGDLMVDHPGKVIIAKEQSCKVTGTFALGRSILFENVGSLEIGTDWHCALVSVKNSGTIIVKRCWQVAILQRFENVPSGQFTMLRTDILSASKITNQGQMNCLLDFNGESCDFINHAGEVQIGGNCTLKSLVNKSETDPSVGPLKIVPELCKWQLFGAPGYSPAVKLTGEEVEIRCRWIVMEKIIPIEKFTGYFESGWPREMPERSWKEIVYENIVETVGDVSWGMFFVSKTMNGTAIENSFSNLYIGGDLNVEKLVVRSAKAIRKKEHWKEKITLTDWGSGNWLNPSDPSRRHAFVKIPNYYTVTEEIIKFVPSVIQVGGAIKGEIQSFMNGEADPTQFGIEKATEGSLEQYQQKLQAIATEVGISEMLLDSEFHEPREIDPKF